MSAEFQSGEVFTDVSPGKTMTSTRANNMINGATLLVGTIANRADIGANGTDVADYTTFQDVSDGAAASPKKVLLANLLPQTVRQGVQQYAAGVQSGGVYAVTLSPAATAYTAGMRVSFKADTANTGAVSINLNALGSKSLVTRAGAALAANDILANQIVDVEYDGTNFYVLNAISAGEVAAAHLTEAAQDDVHQYAADTGVANTYAVTLAPVRTAYTAGMVVRFKALHANTGASTLNVNAIGAINLKAKNGNALVANDILVGQMVTAVYDGTNFQVEVRSQDFTGTGAVPATTAATAIAHGLGAKPSRVRVVLMNNTAAADNGYAQNDEVDISGTQNSSNGNMAFTISTDATNVTVARLNSGNVNVIPKTGGSVATITTANWLVKVYASL